MTYIEKIEVSYLSSVFFFRLLFYTAKLFPLSSICIFCSLLFGIDFVILKKKKVYLSYIEFVI